MTYNFNGIETGPQPQVLLLRSWQKNMNEQTTVPTNHMNININMEHLKKIAYDTSPHSIIDEIIIFPWRVQQRMKAVS